MTKRQKIYLMLLLILGTISQSLTMFRSGMIFDFGMGFWGANGHDGIWHLALINQVFSGFPPLHPTFSGYLLTNYHYFYDFFIGVVNKLTTIPTITLYFQIFPFLISLSLGILSFLVGYEWKKNYWNGFWFAFFNYFGGSFGYLVTLIREGKIGGESIFWSMQSVSTLINPPFAFSLVLLLAGVLLLLKEKLNIASAVLLIIIFGVLINVKAYGGIIGLTGLAFYTFFAFLKNNKKKMAFLGIFGLSSLLAFSFFFSINKEAGSLFVFKPLWFTRSLIESQDRLYLPQIALSLQYLTAKGVGAKRLLVEALAIFLFITGNMGTRLIGFFSLPRKYKQITRIDAFLLPAMSVGFLVPFFFVQKGTAWNTIQFFYYFLFFANFYVSQSLSKINLKKTGGFLAVFLILLFTLPTSISSLKNYFGLPPAALAKEEIEALSYLKKEKDGVVLALPFDKNEKNFYRKAPLPLFVYESTAYVSAFSQKQIFLEDEMNLDISDYPWEERKLEVIRFFATSDSLWARNFLEENNIKYIYLPVKTIDLPVEFGLKKIFENEKSRIYVFSDKI